MIRALTLAALLAATAAPALAQTTAPSSTGMRARAPAASTTTTTTTAPMGASAMGAQSSTTTTTAATTSAAPAGAQGAAMAKVMQTCQADFAKACPGLAPASPEMRTCVTDNFGTLGQPCQGAIMEMMNAGGAG